MNHVLSAKNGESIQNANIRIAIKYDAKGNKALIIDDEYYFKVVQACAEDQEKRHHQNYLALYPICAAMYQHARTTDDTELRRLIVEHNAPDDARSVEIPLILADQQHRLRFVGTHFFDLKTVLKINNP